MKNRLWSFLIAVLVILSSLTVVANGEEELGVANPSLDDMRKAYEAVNDAVKNMGELLGAEQVSVLSKIFNGFVGVATKASTVFGMVNGGVTFLKLVGLVKDTNAENLANIIRELNIVSEKINEMDKKLDNITELITALDVDNKYNSRINRATTLKGNWRNFRLEYMEKELNKKMTDYNAMILNGLKQWFQNSNQNSRNENGVDNRSITVIYAFDEENNIRLYLTDSNTIPEGIRVESKYEITSRELPRSLTWSADTGEENLTGKLEEILKGKYLNLDSEKIKSIASDAYATLVYRIASIEVNRDASFTLNVAECFNNYCSRLFESEYGIDAYIKALYLTHSFEFEISEELTGICDRMILETATYGAFVSGVLSMSDFSTAGTLNACLDTLSSAINALDTAKTSCLTGKPGYCYITNCELLYTCDTIRMSGVYEVHTEPAREYDFRTAAYRGGKLNPTVVNTDMRGKKDAGLVGDSNAMLISLTLRANGITPNHYFFNKNLGSGITSDCGYLMTSREEQATLGFGDSVQMKSYQLIGDYLGGKGSGNIYGFNRLPSDCDDDDFDYRLKITGSLLDLNSNKISTGVLLAAFAGYEEDHWYWQRDEVAFLCGPNRNDNSVKFILHEDKSYYGVAHIGYDRTYMMEANFYYNTLHCVTPEKTVASNKYNPIKDLNAINKELGTVLPTLQPESEGKEKTLEISAENKIDILYIIIAVAVVAAATVAVAVIIRKKRKK